MMDFLLQDRIPDFTSICISAANQSWAILCRSLVDIQHLFRVSGNITTVVPGIENRRGRKHYQSLLVRIGIVQRPVPVQLGLPLLRRRSLWFDRYSRWIGADSSLLWLFLPLYYQSTQRQKITTTCLASVGSIILLYQRNVQLPLWHCQFEINSGNPGKLMECTR